MFTGCSQGGKRKGKDINLKNIFKMNNVRREVRGGRFVDLTLDAGFKAVLADPENIDVLKDIVNAFMPEGRKVDYIEFADRELSPKTETGKGIRLDLRCRTTEGKNIIIEMQNRSTEDFFKRCMYYCAKAYSYNMVKGGKYGDLEPVYLIAFMVEPLSEQELMLEHGKVSWYAMMDVESKYLTPDSFNIIFVRLNEVDCLEEGADEREKYMYYISHMSSFADCPEEDTGTDFEKLFRASERANFNEEKMTQYDLELIHEMDLRAQMDFAVDKGRKEGLAEGKAEGIQEGVQLGLLQSAKAFILSGMSIEQVASILKLSQEDVDRLNLP